jgi:hypothetical protein
MVENRVSGVAMVFAAHALASAPNMNTIAIETTPLGEMNLVFNRLRSARNPE